MTIRYKVFTDDGYNLVQCGGDYFGLEIVEVYNRMSKQGGYPPFLIVGRAPDLDQDNKSE